MKKILLLILLVTSSTLFAREELVLNTESRYNPDYSNRVGLILGLNPSLTKSADITNFTFTYAKQLENFWFDSNLAITSGKFFRLSSNNLNATGASDTQLTDQKNSLMTIGAGIGRETRYAQTLIPIDNLFEYMAANLTYNSYKEDFSGKTFTGPGLLAKFSLYKKISESFSGGFHFNYNLAVVKRSQDFDSETSSQRSLTLGFLTVGVDLSFYL